MFLPLSDPRFLGDGKHRQLGSHYCEGHFWWTSLVTPARVHLRMMLIVKRGRQSGAFEKYTQCA